MVINIKITKILLIAILCINISSCGNNNGTKDYLYLEEQLLALKAAEMTSSEAISAWGEPSMVHNENRSTTLYFSFGPAELGKGPMITGMDLTFVDDKLQNWEWVYGELN